MMPRTQWEYYESTLVVHLPPLQLIKVDMFYKKGTITIILGVIVVLFIKVNLIVSSIKKNPSSEICGAAIKVVVDFRMFMREILDNTMYTITMIA